MLFAVQLILCSFVSLRVFVVNLYCQNFIDLFGKIKMCFFSSSSSSKSTRKCFKFGRKSIGPTPEFALSTTRSLVKFTGPQKIIFHV